MEKNGHSLPQARTIDLVTREMPDEVLVYDLKRHKAHCLNQTAAMVWKYCDGKNTVTDIAELVALEANTAVDEAAVWLALERLGKANLLEERVMPPAGSPRLSRRETVKRLGMGFALSVPVVMSVVSPAAAAAASVCAPTVACTTSPAANCGGCAGTPGSCFTASTTCQNNSTSQTCNACLSVAGHSWKRP